MTRLNSLYTFEFNVSDTEQNHYEQVRFQLSSHPEEPESYTVARALSLAHCLPFHPTLGEGWLDHKEPTLYTYDMMGKYLLWAHVGELHKKLLKAAQRHQSTPEVRFYFYEDSQREHFCHHMRGSKENWIASYSFYQIPTDFLNTILQSGLKRRNQWEISFVEGAIYLSIEDQTIETMFNPIDMWHHYQETLVSESRV